MSRQDRVANGVLAAQLTPLLMGAAPIFGKLALNSGLDPFTLAALRTCLAAALMWIVYLLFFRQYIFIFPAGLLSTLVVGAVNGFGSLLYYNGLLLLNNASLAQLLNMLYVVFTMLLVRIYGQPISGLSLVRAGLALVAVYLLTAGSPGQTAVVWIGVGLMIGSAFTYALHVVTSQRAMFEMPAPTMALYALSWMALTVLVIRLVYGAFLPLGVAPALPVGWLYVLGLTAVTAISRVTLFSGVRNIGSIQTILLNVAELAVTLVAAFVWLGERMAVLQWVGMVVLLVSVFLSRWDSDLKLGPLRMAGMPGLAHHAPPFIDPNDPNAS